jgi:hypothetical protein
MRANVHPEVGSWTGSVLAWVDERLAARGLTRTGELVETRRRPWATVMRAPTSGGPVWFKAAGSGTAFEAGLYEILAGAVPGHVLTPIGTDPRRGWMLLPDGGPVLGELRSGADLLEPMTRAIVRYGEMQRALEPCVAALSRAGVHDMRPAVMPARFDEAIGSVAGSADRAGRGVLRRVEGMRDAVMGWCEQLAASPLEPSLDHNDLHPWNILTSGDDGEPARYYDWGDSVLAHPFAAMLVPLGYVADSLGAGPEDPRVLRVQDAYLEVFGDLAPRRELADVLPVACRVAKIARTLTWERALRAAREQGAPIDPAWSGAAFETLASVLQPSYAGAA